MLVGPVAKALDGADLSFYVGFLVAAIVYLALRKRELSNHASSPGEIEGPDVTALETERSRPAETRNRGGVR